MRKKPALVLSRRSFATAGVAALAMGAACAAAEKIGNTASEEIALWPGAPPGTEEWTGAEIHARVASSSRTHAPMIDAVTNVTRPTLTAYRPPPGTETGAAVIVCPGGAFMGLAIDHEGKMVARRLARCGVVAFVLKYRVRSSANLPADDADAGVPAFEAIARSLEPGRRIAVADGLQALQVVRANAARFRVLPDRVGIMGFSAGGMLTMGTIFDGRAEQRPNFAACIYGAMQNKIPSRDAPPLFIAAAQDDATVPVEKSVAMFSAWTAAKLPAALHIYETGGHGFGLLPLGFDSDDWIRALQRWMVEHAWAKETR